VTGNNKSIAVLETAGARQRGDVAVADILEVILSDHRRIRRLQQGLREAARMSGSKPGWVLPHTWERLASLIEILTITEEEICWLPMSAAVPEIRARAREMAAVGADIREAIAEARLVPCRTPPWWRAVNDALAACAAQMECVEQEILPTFARHADQRLCDRLSRQWLVFQAAYGGDRTGGSR
jgi:RecJ-like exonuclease